MNEELIEIEIMNLCKLIGNEILCKRCGKCCVVLNWNTDKWEHCRNLRQRKNGKTFCRIYKSRIGTDIRYGFKCGFRKDFPWDVPDCPYNTGKRIHPAYLNTEE